MRIIKGKKSVNELLREAPRERIKAAKYLPTETPSGLQMYEISITPRFSEHKSTRFCFLKHIYLPRIQKSASFFKISYPYVPYSRKAYRTIVRPLPPADCHVTQKCTFQLNFTL